MGDTLDDLVYSASTTSTGNTRIPVKQLVHVMRSADLSTKSIQDSLGKRRIIKGDEAPGDRYCQALLESASSLIKRIETHIERGNLSLSDGNSFSFDADTAAYKRSDGLSNATICPIEFTRGDRKSLRKLAVMGCLTEADAYVNAVRAASDRMMERIEQITPTSTEQAYADLVCEFPYNPYEEEEQPSLPNKRINEKSNYHGTPPLHNGVGGQIAWHLLATSIYKTPITRKI
ncbi:hypothetical protein [Erwinia billingiae]|uniref:hypothetical protein n=1 Tax=Erwinia billingiae TaxID=182337 RepID=UPI00320B31FD